MSLQTVVDLLRCPRCGSGFDLAARSLRCQQGHVFDLARQGYANLTGAAQPTHADTAAMVAARAELLGSNRFAAVTAGLMAALPDAVGEVLDVGTGTGYYAAAVLDERPGARALGLDISVPACRRAARSHARLGVAAADAWAALPVGDHCVDVLLNVFSPRNPAEFVRVLRPAGAVITVTPGADHLAELRDAFGLLGVQDAKGRRLAESFGRSGLIEEEQRVIHVREPWPLDDAVRSIMMGPNAFHHDPIEVKAAAAGLAWPRPVTVSCVITRWASPDLR